MSDTNAVDQKVVIGNKRSDTAPSRKSDKSEPNMHVLVHSPFREYYDGLAYSITAQNATGEFDVLPHHHNFISLLEPCDLMIRTLTAGDLKISISGGLMHVKADQLVVFLDI